MHENKFSRRMFLASIPAAAATLALTGCGKNKTSRSTASSLSSKIILMDNGAFDTLRLLKSDGTQLGYPEGCDFPSLIRTCIDGKIPVRKNNKFGYIDIEGNILLEPVYDSVPTYTDGVFTIEQDERIGYADADGSIFLPPQYKHAGIFSHGLAPVASGEYWGFIDRSGEFVIQPQFICEPEAFSENFAFCRSNNRDSGIIDREGNWKATNFSSYTNPFQFYDGYALALSHESEPMCYVDSSGELCFGKSFSHASSFSEERAIVIETDDSDLMGFIDTSGNYILTPQADIACPFHEGLAFIHSTAFTGFIDKNGQQVFSIKAPINYSFYSRTEVFIQPSYGFLRVEDGCVFVPFENDSSKLLDTKGKVVFDFAKIEKEYGTVLYAHGGKEKFAITKKNENYHFINFKGKTIADPRLCFSISIIDSNDNCLYTV